MYILQKELFGKFVGLFYGDLRSAVWKLARWLIDLMFLFKALYSLQASYTNFCFPPRKKRIVLLYIVVMTPVFSGIEKKTNSNYAY